MTNKYNGMFLEEDTGGDFGGGESDASRGTAVFEDGGGAGRAEAEERPAATPAPAPPPVQTAAQVDARQLAQEFGSVIGQHFQPPQKELSIEEAKRILNVWEPTDEWIKKYENLETRGQALAEQRDGMIRQADTIMQYRMREMQNEMERRYAPAVYYMQQQEAQHGEWRFGQSFPQLNRPELRPLLYSVAQSLLASGHNFKSEGEMFDMLARGVESVIKVNNPDFKLEVAGNGQPVGAARARPQGSIPVTTPGAGGAMSGSGAKPPAKPRGLAIFDP